MDIPNLCKQRLAPLRAAMYDFDADGVRAALTAVCAPDLQARFGEPLGDSIGPDAFYNTVYGPLFAAIPDLERRDYIVCAGEDDYGSHWVGCAGFYTGVFTRPWLDIPPTGHIASVRFHEFYRFDGDKVMEIQALWDIPDLMMQANAWPMAPSLGREWLVPGPGTADGLVGAPYDAALSETNKRHIVEMLTAMKRHPAEGGPEAMELERFWHPRMNWYGPGGIGTGRGVDGFRKWHQIPFLNAMPDRGQYVGDIIYHFFGDGPYVGVTGWPDMIQTLTHPGWMGIAPTGARVTMRSLDFWRIENGLIRENWVMVDLMDLYRQINVDPLARLREFNKARAGFSPEDGRAL